ncbi:hypothetical protein RvY_15084 [Ramazzottius varieornatus]|uniref:Uncharacterized protein n=1 Tax=Ramazzottius varieornatus TaxID=947166 RepID=A0A1D1VVB5_RAMVA|nr:hypothetical protein RvY_15084 [Ramazzottius varieornatus]
MSFGELSGVIRRLDRAVDEVRNLRNLCLLSERPACLTREQVNEHLKDKHPDLEPRLILTRGLTGKALTGKAMPCIARHTQGN